MLNFYMTPGSCTTGIHILLEELELVFSANIVNLVKGDQHTPEFRAINPRGTIPVLVLNNGQPLTSFLEIAWWLGSAYPKKGLIPTDPVAQARMLDLLSYAVNHIHGQAFTRIFTPSNYFVGDAEPGVQEPLLYEQGKAMVITAFEWVAGQIQANIDAGLYACGQFSLADAALFYVEFWAVRSDIPLPEACQQHYQAMLKRPLVRQVLMEEGYRV
ncbi:glutathione S-transferase family protein [Halioxenophilus sp. WMMB6]|uniref:glutathione S-transferase family protein n=1 Tax=Halioxenophilus sp. WMMB6 TaxID=3073815 RepID=UPI00295E540E|nr:glutathione S-transferase N-terminal domain-containing protein [Halioxenophilus sp. WMMB6]